MAAIFPKPFQSGFRLNNGDDLDALFDFPLVSTEDSITATAGGGKTSAHQLSAVVSRVTVVATAGDSVKLPPSKVGAELIVINSDAADPMQVYGNGTDTINSVATATGITQPSGTAWTYTCTTLGAWVTLSGSSSDVINGDTKLVTTTTTSTNTTTLAAITGLSVQLTSAGTYAILAKLPISTNGTAGAKLAVATSNSVTATSINVTGSFFTASGVAVANTTVLGSGIGSTATVVLAELAGAIVVSTGGTLIVSAAQNVATTGTTSFLANGFLQVTRTA